MNFKIFFSLFFCTIFSAQLLVAQVQQGSNMIGGSSAGVSFNDDAVGISLTPNLLHFIADRVGIGAGLGLDLVRADGETLTSSFSFSPTVRYYVTDGSPIKVFGQGLFGIGSFKFLGDKSRFSTLGLALGADYFLNEHVALEGSLGWNSVKVKDVDRDGNFGLSFGVQVFFGGDSKK
jgi:hypothetical protein